MVSFYASCYSALFGATSSWHLNMVGCHAPPSCLAALLPYCLTGALKATFAFSCFSIEQPLDLSHCARCLLLAACCMRHTAHCRWNVDCSTALYLHWRTHTQKGAACNDRQSWWRHGLAGCMPRCPMPRALHCVSCTSHWDFLPGEPAEQQAEIISLFSGTRAYGKYDSTHTHPHTRTPRQLQSVSVWNAYFNVCAAYLHVHSSRWACPILTQL